MKIVLSLSTKHAGKKASAKAPLKVKRVRTADGKTVTLRTLNANSDSFGRDLGAVFQRNVRKARTERPAKGSSGRIRASSKG